MQGCFSKVMILLSAQRFNQYLKNLVLTTITDETLIFFFFSYFTGKIRFDVL